MVLTFLSISLENVNKTFSSKVLDAEQNQNTLPGPTRAGSDVVFGKLLQLVWNSSVSDNSLCLSLASSQLSIQSPESGAEILKPYLHSHGGALMTNTN